MPVRPSVFVPGHLCVSRERRHVCLVLTMPPRRHSEWGACLSHCGCTRRLASLRRGRTGTDLLDLFQSEHSRKDRADLIGNEQSPKDHVGLLLGEHSRKERTDLLHREPGQWGRAEWRPGGRGEQEQTNNDDADPAQPVVLCLRFGIAIVLCVCLHVTSLGPE
jgi:hypothetical protein